MYNRTDEQIDEWVDEWRLDDGWKHPLMDERMASYR